jgi:pyruvate dehydrogenase E1 component
MLPFYIYYSMFGFQRVGDAIWAAADQRARGFLLGATSGRTTLGGEGLQHQDGSSHLVAATIPNCKAYDPAFAGELAIILDAGIREMVEQQADVFYYITLMNENYANPNIALENTQGVLRGAYQFGKFTPENAQVKQQVTLMGSGAILLEVLIAAKVLLAQGIDVEVVSVTSWSELARDGRSCTDQGTHKVPYLTDLLSKRKGPVLAASDYVCAVTECVRAFVPEGRIYKTLGTDGFGRSDTRAALRHYFGVDAAAIVRGVNLMLP